MFAKFLKDESGATAIEYGLIAGLISVVIIATVTAVGGDLKGVFGKLNAALDTANTASTESDGT
ncbi:Flp family type IVb pilin [Polycladidibacter hongkongensis]|uniref:Flp family type IVb pilin n=1 Tax=Polycladidibacter hongkongensis TaxID=1647556 RepID=UPI0008356914|nr:Flp family type IVb pilin [Pseudovibrio hongkongensis]